MEQTVSQHRRKRERKSPLPPSPAIWISSAKISIYLAVTIYASGRREKMIILTFWNILFLWKYIAWDCCEDSYFFLWGARAEENKEILFCVHTRGWKKISLRFMGAFPYFIRRRKLFWDRFVSTFTMHEFGSNGFLWKWPRFVLKATRFHLCIWWFFYLF